MSIISSSSKPSRKHHAAFRAKRIFSRGLIYGVLLFWSFVCLFPIYWTVTTAFKSATDVTQGHLIPWLDFQPDWKGWRSLGLSPDTILQGSNPRDEFVSRFENSVITSVGASILALVLGSLAAYGLSRFRYKFAWMRNDDILFFFMSQLILPPVVLACTVLGSLQGIVAVGHANWTDPDLYLDGAADRHLDYARPIQLDPNRAR